MHDQKNSGVFVEFTLQGPGVCLYGIHDDLYIPPTSTERIFYLVSDIEFILYKTLKKVEEKRKSYVTIVIIYMRLCI